MKTNIQHLKQWGNQFGKSNLAIAAFKLKLERYPKLSVFLMLLLISLSALITFTTLRITPEGKSANSFQGYAPAPSMPAGAVNLLEVFSLQAELKSFIDKKTPSRQDSIKMEELIKRIDQLNQKIKRNEKD